MPLLRLWSTDWKLFFLTSPAERPAQLIPEESPTEGVEEGVDGVVG